MAKPTVTVGSIRFSINDFETLEAMRGGETRNSFIAGLIQKEAMWRGAFRDEAGNVGFMRDPKKGKEKNDE